MLQALDAVHALFTPFLRAFRCVAKDRTLAHFFRSFLKVSAHFVPHDIISDEVQPASSLTQVIYLTHNATRSNSH